MADTPQTLALTLLAQNYAGEIVRQANRTSTALRVLPIKVGEGKNVAWAVESTGAVAEAYAEGADAANFGSDGQAGPTLPWTSVRANSRITGLAEAAAATSMTPKGNVRVVGRNVVNAAGALASLVNGYVFSGDGTASPAQPTGLNFAIGDNTNTYAGIDKTASSYWQSTVSDPGSATALTQAQIRGDVSAIYTASGEYPDIGLVAPAVFDQLLGLFDSRSQFTKFLDSVTTARGTIQLTGNYRGIEVEGVTFLRDKDATAGQIYYLNSNYVCVEILPSAMLRERYGLEDGQQLVANDGFGEVPLLATFEPLAKTGDSKKFQIKSYLNVKVEKPNSCGIRKNVATS